MKKIYSYSVIVVCMLLGFQACKPDKFLDTPVPSITDAIFFENDAAALSVLPGVYDPAGWGNYSQYLQWAIGDVVSDDAVKGGGGDGDQPQMYDLEHFQASEQTAVLESVWSDLYVGINRANKLIKGVTDNSKISADVQKRLIAESKFLRAYYNFCLVRIFGGIPIVDHILVPSEYSNPRNTIEECWAFIESDLKAAIPDLPLKSAMSADDLGRASWGSAAALLTKAYIYQEKWTEADALATQLLLQKNIAYNQIMVIFLLLKPIMVWNLFSIFKEKFSLMLRMIEARQLMPKFIRNHAGMALDGDSINLHRIFIMNSKRVIFAENGQ